jgi:uncharacterized membrane protein
MNEKTSKFVWMTVAFVALVAFAGMVTPHNTSANYYGTYLTGNVASEEIGQTSFVGFTKLLVSVTLIGACVYMYKQYL